MLPCDACTENVAKCANLVDNQDLTLENRVEIIVSILCDENVYCVELTQSYGVGIINLLNSSTKRGEFCYNLGVCTTY